MPTWKNNVKFASGSTGTGSFSIGAAVDGFRTPAQAGYTNGQTCSYTARVGTAFENGLGTYSTSGPALARTTVRQSSNGDAAVDFATAPVVMLAPLAEDFDHIYQEIEGAAVDVASASTTNIGAAASSKVRITGTTTITAFDTVAAGITREGYFSGALTLTHNGTSLILPGAANITTAANDRFRAMSLGSGNWIVLFYEKASGAPIVGYVPGGTDVAVADGGTGASTGPAARIALGIGAPDVILEDQKSQNTNGGSFTSGADRTRDLNTEVYDPNGYCSLSSNQFTLVAGTYYIEWAAPATYVDAHQSMLYDVTGSAVLKRGQSRFGQSQYVYETVNSEGQHIVTIGSSNIFEIRHRCQTTGLFGEKANFGTEIYTIVKIWRVG